MKFSKLLVFIIILSCLKPAFGQQWDPFIQSVVDQVSYDSVLNNLQLLESFGRKDIVDTNLAYTGEWLIQSYQQMGYTDIQTDSFELYNHQLYNIIVTKTGSEFPDKYLIIDGHYDTRTGPGVNDNGSGVAIILEIARLLQSIPTQYSIRFINFSAEEYGLIGSQHYVQEVVIPEDMDIRLVFNIDEVGGVNGMVNDTVTCERDESPPVGNNDESWAFTDTLVALTTLYSTLKPSIYYAYGSDYVPFQGNGEVITGLYEYNESPYPHTIHDSLSNLDVNYVFEIAKLSVAAGLYFSCAYDTGTGQEENLRTDLKAHVFPNPFSGNLCIKTEQGISDFGFKLWDEIGQLVYKKHFTDASVSVFNAENLDPGFYFYRIYQDDGKVISQGKVIKIKSDGIQK